MIERTNRSDAYQHLFAEIPTDYDVLDAMQSPHTQTTEREKDLREKLYLRTLALLRSDPDFETYFDHFANGLTQTEIAQTKNLSQSTVCRDLKDDEIRERFLDVLLNDKRIQVLLHAIEDCRAA